MRPAHSAREILYPHCKSGWTNLRFNEARAFSAGNRVLHRDIDDAFVRLQ